MTACPVCGRPIEQSCVENHILTERAPMQAVPVFPAKAHRREQDQHFHDISFQGGQNALR